MDDKIKQLDPKLLKEAVSTAKASNIPNQGTAITGANYGELAANAPHSPASSENFRARGRSLGAEQSRRPPGPQQPRPDSVFDRYSPAASQTARPDRQNALGSEQQRPSMQGQPPKAASVFDRYSPIATPESTPQPTKAPTQDRDR